MRKIIEYTIVSSQNIEDLEFIVTKGLREGWQPYGGIGITKTHAIQPMVKYAEEKCQDINDPIRHEVTGQTFQEFYKEYLESLKREEK